MTNRRVSIAGGLAAIVAVSGFMFLQCGHLEGLADSSHGAVANCEKLLLKSLKAPSTYRRISARFIEQPPFSKEQIREYEMTKYCGLDENYAPCTETNEFLISYGAKLIGDKNHIIHPTKKQAKEMRHLYWEMIYKGYQRRPPSENVPATVQIDYDAANSYGTPLRETEFCKFGPKNGGLYKYKDMYGDAKADITE